MPTRATVARLLAAGTLAPAVVRAQAPTVVRIGGAVTSDILPILYGIRAGVFRSLGLDVQLASTLIGAQLASAIAGDALDIAKSSLLSLILGYMHGLPFRLVAAGGLYTPEYSTTGICVPSSSPIRSPSDINGKTVASSSLRGYDQLGLQALIDRSGGNSATVKFVELPFSQMPAALDQGSVDVADIALPTLAAALATGRIRSLGDPYSGIGQHVLIAAWFCTAEYGRRNADVVRRFAAGVRSATEYTNAHYVETSPILAEYAHVDPAALAKMRHGINATSLEEADIQRAIDAAARYKFIDRPFGAGEMILRS